MLAEKNQLLEELSADNINVLRVRDLCRDNPGLVATAGLRVRVWSLLLLGKDYEATTGASLLYNSINRECEQFHVLVAGWKYCYFVNISCYVILY